MKATNPHIVVILEEFSEGRIELIHATLDQIATDRPGKAEHEDSADERVESNCVHLWIRRAVVLEYQVH